MQRSFDFDGFTVSAQDDHVNGQTSIRLYNQSSFSMQSVEALAEIFDFAAGLVQSVPKKTSVAKSDLLNTTARLWKQNASATVMNCNLWCFTAAPEVIEFSVYVYGS